MKKNNMLRIASVLLVAVLLSTCAISGAFAKYTTSLTSESETARVAKFGITLAAAAPDMFAGTYDAKEVDLNGAENDGLGLSVSAATDVLAPGTNGALANCFTITDDGREVAVNVAYAATVTLTGWSYTKEVIEDGETTTQTFDYCPIIITVGTTDYYVGMNNEVTNSAKLAEAVSEAASASADYAVGATIGAAPAISWRWNFEKENALTNSIQNDVEDTILGKAGSATVTINVTATVTQID